MDDTKPTVSNRDVIIGEGAEVDSHKANLFLDDLILLQKVLWLLKGNPTPRTQNDVTSIGNHVISVIEKGQLYEMAGLREVPHPVFKNSGRFVLKEGQDYKTASRAEIKAFLLPKVLKVFSDPASTIATGESPYKDLKSFMDNQGPSTVAVGVPDAKDVVLFGCHDNANVKLYDNHGANKTVFHLASQLVTHFTSTTDRRVEAALQILKALNETQVEDDKTKELTNRDTKFLVRTAKDEESISWTKLTSEQAIEFTLIFTFEVFLEKQIHMLPEDPSLMYTDLQLEPPGSEGIDEPTDYDVLFGRGGFTNSHYGNRRFRDIIALHRPDYIRAIKMEKPNVARKIVKAIRFGDPPGRFLKKGEDGKFYDVGDRIAAEKTSQGLRERTNAEKRQRSALREALRIRKEDMDEDEATPAAKKSKTASTEAAAALAASTVPILNYIGTNLSVPLSLSMKEMPKNTVSRSRVKFGEGLQTAGLPPNAVDEDGNILVTDYDILLGRGGLTNHHLGNKRFRDVVALHRPDYTRAPKIQKPSVARVIVRAIRNGDPPGRFLSKDEKTGKWYDVGDKKAAEKTSQALREKSNEERDKVKRESGALSAALLPNYGLLTGTAGEEKDEKAGGVDEEIQV